MFSNYRHISVDDWREWDFTSQPSRLWVLFLNLLSFRYNRKLKASILYETLIMSMIIQTKIGTVSWQLPIIMTETLQQNTFRLPTYEMLVVLSDWIKKWTCFKKTQPSFSFQPTAKCIANWKRFVKNLWKFHLLKTKVSLSQEIRFNLQDRKVLRRLGKH